MIKNDKKKIYYVIMNEVYGRELSLYFFLLATISISASCQGNYFVCVCNYEFV